MLKSLLKKGTVMKMNGLDKLAYLLVVIGGLNWGLIGFFKYDLVGKIFSEGLARVIYGAVGVAALYMFLKMLMMMGEMNKGKSAKSGE